MTTAAENSNPDIEKRCHGVDDLPDQWKHLPVSYLIHCTNKHIVFLDPVGDLDWETSDECDLELQKTLKRGELGRIRNMVATLQAYPVEHLSAAQVRTFRIMTGEGLARGHSCEVAQSFSMLQSAREYVVARSQEVARLWYLSATFWCAGIFFVVGIIGWLLRELIRPFLGVQATDLAVISCYGALGALFFILLRVGKTPLDPAIGKSLHRTEGVGRILVGVIAAGVAQLAVKSGILLPFLQSQGNGALLLVAIIAGASERLVPTLIGRVENGETSEGTSKKNNESLETGVSS